MPSLARQALLPLLNRNGTPVATISITPVNLGTLWSLDEREVATSGEERVQLLEYSVYRYEVRGAPPGLRLRASDIIVPNSRYRDRGTSGRIRIGPQAGVLPLTLEDRWGNGVATASIELKPLRLTYDPDYRHMLDFIAEHSIDLVMDVRSPIEVRVAPDPGVDARSLQERFAFVKSILDSKDFHEAVERIVAMPHRLLKSREEDQSVRRRFKPSGKTLRQILYRTPRQRVPGSHPLAARMKELGMPEASTATRITGTRRDETVDTLENRFVKHTLAVYSDFLLKMERALVGEESSAQHHLRSEICRLREEMEGLLARDFFREISEPALLPLGSPVLQRKEGYREVLRSWLRFNMAARLAWSSADDAHRAGSRDLARLYECWLFFQLLRLVAKGCDAPLPAVGSLIREEAGGLSFTLKSDHEFVTRARWDGDPPVRVRVSYKGEFLRRDVQASHGLWTRKPEPDFAIMLWPAALSREDAEERQLLRSIDVDFNYYAEPAMGLFDAVTNLVRAELDEPRRPIAKRTDLRKMFAYREASRGDHGAYVLYPGDRYSERQELHKISPGVWAFAIRPGPNGGAIGADALTAHLEETKSLVRSEFHRHVELGAQRRRKARERAYLRALDRIRASDPFLDPSELEQTER